VYPSSNGLILNVSGICGYFPAFNGKKVPFALRRGLNAQSAMAEGETVKEMFRGVMRSFCSHSFSSAKVMAASISSA
jgi:hypothetical protein